MKAYKHNGSGSSLGALVKVTPTTEAGEWSDDYRRGRVDGLEQARVEAEARIAPLREALLDAFREAKARIAVSHEAPPARAPLDVDRLRAAAQAVVDWSSDPHHRLDPGTESRVNALRAALEEPPT